MVESSSTPVSPISTASVGPRKVVESFLRLTVDRPDLKKARLHLSKRSQVADLSVSAMPPGTLYTLGAEMADELGKWIPVNVTSPVTAAGLREMTVPMVVVQEDGQWKIDLPATMERLMGKATGAVGQVMSAVGDVMAQAMDTVLTAFGTDAPAKTAPAPNPATPAPSPAPAVKAPVRQAIRNPAKKRVVAKKPAKRKLKASAKKLPVRKPTQAAKKSGAKKTPKKKRR